MHILRLRHYDFYLLGMKFLSSEPQFFCLNHDLEIGLAPDLSGDLGEM